MSKTAFIIIVEDCGKPADAPLDSRLAIWLKRGLKSFGLRNVQTVQRASRLEALSSIVLTPTPDGRPTPVRGCNAQQMASEASDGG